MRCDFKPTDDSPDERGWRIWQCSREGCKRKTGRTPDKADRIFATCKVLGWGDVATYYLALFGLTKQRVQWFTGKPCKCGERSQQLDAIGDRVTKSIGSLALRFRLFCQRAFSRPPKP